MSDSSVATSSSSRVRQFGLYRTIDARTEEFLRLSRKRQIKQGCACAAISTTITVTVVIVILLIYEYAIAVESSLVQSKRKGNRIMYVANITNDSPVADRLDRSYFGFDQDYYERMPLLVNAMQENNYEDPTLDIKTEYKEKQKVLNAKQRNMNSNNFHQNHPRRTSPRPFLFEYKSPTPVPFSKTFGSKSWIDSYRNAQRLKNIHDVIKYLEKTINAKIGDMYTEPPRKHIAFSGVYVEPGIHEKSLLSENEDSLIDSSVKTNTITNHKSDPLFKFKPDSPGDINLLADGFLRFSPVPTPSLIGRKEFTNVPMFRPIPNRKKNCVGQSCGAAFKKINDFQTSSSETQFSDSTNHGKTKTFSVMLNLYPLKADTDHLNKKMDATKVTPLDNIYITTSRPLVLFKRKSNIVHRRRFSPSKRPRIAKEHKLTSPYSVDDKLSSREKINDSVPGNVILHINVYSPEKTTESAIQINNTTESLSSTTPINQLKYNYHTPYTTDVPIHLSTTQVEDFHIGSSGVIPIEARTTSPPVPDLPKVTTIYPFFDVTLSSTEGPWYTKPPDILKFSHEDAKIPEEYRRYRESDVEENIFSDLNRRNFRDTFELEDIEPRTLVTKLKNEIETTTSPTFIEETTKKEEITTTVTTTTQINGHYRSVNQNSRILSKLLDPNSEINRKRRLSLLAKGFRRHELSHSYVEINRNKTKVDDDSEHT